MIDPRDRTETVFKPAICQAYDRHEPEPTSTLTAALGAIGVTLLLFGSAVALMELPNRQFAAAPLAQTSTTTELA